MKGESEQENNRLDVEVEAAGQAEVVQQVARSVAALLRRFHLQQRPLRPSDALAIQGDADRLQVRNLAMRVHALPEELRGRLPALLNGLGMLQTAAGEFDQAQHDFQAATGAVTDPVAHAGVLFNAYQTALERRDGREALQLLQRAAGLDGGRFAPFPVSRYEPEHVVGVESTGVRFLCRDKTVGAIVAVKALWPRNLELPAEEIFRQARTLDDLGQPAVPRLRDAGFADADQHFPFLVTDHFDGPTLADHVKHHGPYSPDELYRILRPVVEALGAAHERGILHRNLKPTKIQARLEATGWKVRIIDFALGPKRSMLLTAIDSGPLWAKSVLGTSAVGALPFVAPEEIGLVDGFPIGPHSDVYALGKSCYFALLGTPEPDDEEKETLPPAWRQLLGQCTARSPARRLANMPELGKRLLAMPAPAEKPAAAPTPLPPPLPTSAPAATPPSAVEAVQNYVQRGMTYRQHGDFDRAIAAFTRALEFDPNQPATYLKRGNAYADRGDHDRAIADYTALIKLEPGNALGFMNRGLAHAKKGQFDKVLTDCNAAVALDPKLAAAYYIRGVAYSSRGERHRAIAEFTLALRLDPKNSLAYVDRGLNFSEEGDHDRAITDFTAALRIDPRLAVAYLNRGIAFRLRGEAGVAVADFSRTIKLDPRNLLAFFNRGLCYLDRKAFSQAVADFDRVLHLDPNHTEAAGRRAEAVQLRNKARKNKPLSKPALASQAAAAPAAKAASPAPVKAAKTSAEKAEDERRQLKAAAYYAQARTFFDQGDYANAIDQFNKAIEADPNDAQAFYHRGLAHAAKDAYREAVADYTASLRLIPRNPQAYYQRGMAYRLARQPDRAIADFSRTLKLEPRMALAYRNRGLAYAAKGDNERAKADYEAAVRIDPNLAKE